MHAAGPTCARARTSARLCAARGALLVYSLFAKFRVVAIFSLVTFHFVVALWQADNKLTLPLASNWPNICMGTHKE